MDEKFDQIKEQIREYCLRPYVGLFIANCFVHTNPEFEEEIMVQIVYYETLKNCRSSFVRICFNLLINKCDHNDERLNFSVRQIYPSSKSIYPKNPYSFRCAPQSDDFHLNMIFLELIEYFKNFDFSLCFYNQNLDNDLFSPGSPEAKNVSDLFGIDGTILNAKNLEKQDREIKKKWNDVSNKIT